MGVLGVRGASASVVEADGVAVVSPDMPEIPDEIIIGVIITHLRQKIAIADAKLLQNSLKRNQGQFSLEKVSPIQAIQTIRPKNPGRLLQDSSSLRITDVVSRIELHGPELRDDLVDFLVISACVAAAVPATLWWKS